MVNYIFLIAKQYTQTDVYKRKPVKMNYSIKLILLGDTNYMKLLRKVQLNYTLKDGALRQMTKLYMMVQIYLKSIYLTSIIGFMYKQVTSRISEQSRKRNFI